MSTVNISRRKQPGLEVETVLRENMWEQLTLCMMDFTETSINGLPFN